jgi:plasmid stabilization system protein ParE
MKVVYGRRAQTDIDEIFNYIVKQDPRAAHDVETAIRKACEQLSKHPYANPRIDRPNSFRMPIPGRGYAVFYRVRPRLERVEIVRVVRGRRLKSLARPGNR